MDDQAWAPEFGGRIGFPPPEENELILSINMGCADTVPFRPISNPRPIFCPQILEPRTKLDQLHLPFRHLPQPMENAKLV